MRRLLGFLLGFAVASACLIVGNDVVALEIGNQALHVSERDLDSETGWVDPPPPPPEVDTPSDRKEVTIDPPDVGIEAVPQPDVVSPSDAMDPVDNGPTLENYPPSDSGQGISPITGKPSTPLHPTAELPSSSSKYLATPIHP